MNSTIVIHKITSASSSALTVFKKIWTPAWKTLSFSLADDAIFPATSLSVSIDKGTLSVVHGSRFLSRIKIKGMREYSFEEGKYPQPEVIASSLALAINDLGASGVRISLGIPKAWAVMKTAEFPSTVKPNLSDVIKYELDRLTPFSSENAFYDFRILGEHDGKLTVFIVAAKADVVIPYIEAFGEKGIAVERLTTNISGIETLCRYADNKTDAVFVEIKKDTYEGTIFLNRAITGTVTGNFDTDDETTKAGSIIAEISALTDTAKQHSASPQLFLLLRDKSSTLKEILKSQLKQPAKILNETDMKISLTGQYKEIPYAAIGGVIESLWQKADALNLLNKGYHEKRKTPMIFTIILLFLILIMWILYLIAPLRIEENRLQEIDREITLRKEEVRKVETLKKEIEELNSDIAAIRDFKGNRQMTLNILKELTTIIPKNVWVSRLRITETGVELEGYAASATGILSKLESSPYFQKVEFASPTFRDTRMNADRFNIRMEKEGVKKQEVQEEDVGNEEE